MVAKEVLLWLKTIVVTLLVSMELTKLAKKGGFAAGKRLLVVGQLLRLEMATFMNKMSTTIHLIELLNKVWCILAGVRLEDSPYSYLQGGGRSGSTLIAHIDGYTFNHHSTNKTGQARWTCSRKYSKCRAALKIEDGFVFEKWPYHNHGPFKTE